MVEDSVRGPFYGATLDDVRAMIQQRGAEAVMHDTLEAVERVNGELNAAAYVDAEGALASARRLDAGGEPVGPLHGIPLAVKDLMGVEGWPLTCGSKVRAEEISDGNCEGVARLRAAGAIPVVSSITHEFAYGPTGDATAYGPVHNPHDLSRMTGGSSGGSGALVGAGVVPLALGTDTGGSIRIPAALCGTVGLKATHGAVPTDGVFPLAPSLDHLGPLTIDVTTAQAAFEVMSQRSIADAEVSTWSWLDLAPIPACDPRVVDLVRRAAEEAAGTLRQIAMPDFAPMRATGNTVMAREAFLGHESWLDERRSDYIPEVWDRFDAGRTITDDAYREALTEMARLRTMMTTQIGPSGVVVSPSVTITAPRIGERETTVNGERAATRLIVTNLTILWNVTGMPTISVPVGDVDGLPVSAQITGVPGAEDVVLAAARAMERRRS